MSDYGARKMREDVGRMVFFVLDWLAIVSIPLFVVLFVGVFSGGLAEWMAGPFIALFEGIASVMKGWHI